VIVNGSSDVQSLIEDFARAHKLRQIAISADLLDASVDAPHITTLVFFKSVYSKTSTRR